MELTSTAFGANQPIPGARTAKGAGTRPPLTIKNVPPAAQSIALIMHDPDAPGGDFVHWLIWNLPPITSTFGAHDQPNGARQGKNDFGQIGYGPPAPPSDIHRYVFDLYAVDTELPLAAGATRDALLAA